MPSAEQTRTVGALSNINALTGLIAPHSTPLHIRNRVKKGCFLPNKAHGREIDHYFTLNWHSRISLLYIRWAQPGMVSAMDAVTNE